MSLPKRKNPEEILEEAKTYNGRSLMLSVDGKAPEPFKVEMFELSISEEGKGKSVRHHFRLKPENGGSILPVTPEKLVGYFKA